MSARNLLTQTPPHAVEASLERLGRDLRVARLRRNLTMAQVAERIGAGVRAVADAEKGKATTAVAVYLALLWAYGLLGDVALLAAPERDAEGEALAALRAPRRATSTSSGGILDDDF
jgi:transcriptional regulator with XRE-family HTH domain